MGLFGDILGVVGKGAAYSAGLLASSADTMHEYTSYVDRDISSDVEYRTLLEEALRSIVQERDMDDYLEDISRRRYTLSRFAVKYAHYPEKGGSVVCWKLFFEPSPTLNDTVKVVCIKLITPNALQLKYDGSRIDTRYGKYEFCYGSNRSRTSVARESSDDSSSDGVFGVLMGADYTEYVSKKSRRHSFGGGVYIVRAKIDFPFECSHSSIIVNESDGKVCGVLATIKAEDCDDSEYKHVKDALCDEFNIEFEQAEDGDEAAEIECEDVDGDDVTARMTIGRGDEAVNVMILCGYYVSSDDDDADSDGDECENDSIEVEEEEHAPVARPTYIRRALKSFLGVKFGDSVDEYADDFSESETLQGGMEAVQGRVNEFMEFNDCNVLYNATSRKVCGVFCTVADDDLKDPDEYCDEVVSILEKKFMTKAVVRKNVRAFPFTAPGNDRPRHMIIVRHVDHRVDLMAWDFGLAAEKARPKRNRRNDLDAL